MNSKTNVKRRKDQIKERISDQNEKESHGQKSMGQKLQKKKQQKK